MNKELILNRSRIKYNLNENLVLIGIIILVIITASIEPKFFTSSNLTNIMRQFGPLSIVSLGMTFVIIGGFIDLSIAGIISLVAVITVYLIEPLGQFPALLVGLCLGAVLGFINSVILIKSGAMTQAEALFITYAMSLVYGALALLAVDGATKHMRFIKSDISIFETIGSGKIGFISVSFIIFAVSLIILHVFQTRTYMGRAICLTGGNKVAAELSGIPVKKSIMFIYTICGFMSGLGSIVLFSRVTTASPVIGLNYETNTILAVVVGGTTLKGGKGSVIRTMLGVALITLMSNCLNLLNVSTFVQTIMKGAILVIAIWLDNRKEQQ